MFSLSDDVAGKRVQPLRVNMMIEATVSERSLAPWNVEIRYMEDKNGKILGRETARLLAAHETVTSDDKQRIVRILPIQFTGLDSVFLREL